MEAEERPNKLRKLDHDRETDTANTIASDKQTPEQPSTTTAPNDLEETQQGDVTGPAPLSEQPVSKSQLKKLRRQQQWEEGREARKARRKEQQKAKKARKREAINTNEDQPEPKPSSINADGVAHETQQQQQPRPAKRVKSIQTPLTLILDCSFDDLMTDKEKVSLGSQITRCYSDNRNAAYRAHLVISSFSGGLKERFETVLSNHHRGWKGVKFTEDDFVSAAQEAQKRMQQSSSSSSSNNGNNDSQAIAGCAALRHANAPNEGEIIYLTSDSPNTLTELRAYDTYIIGGLVDRNRHKGICYQRAMDRGVKTAKLPIGDYLQMASRFVLTTNQVVEIMLNWLECGDWAQAFLKVMPKRKGGVLKTKIEGDECGKVETGGNDEEVRAENKRGGGGGDRAEGGEELPGGNKSAGGDRAEGGGELPDENNSGDGLEGDDDSVKAQHDKPTTLEEQS